MRANDQVTTEYIQELETDNDHLRAENQALLDELKSVYAELAMMKKDREFCL